MNIGRSAVHPFKHPKRMQINIVPTLKYLFLSMDKLIKGFFNFDWRFTNKIKVIIPIIIGKITR